MCHVQFADMKQWKLSSFVEILEDEVIFLATVVYSENVHNWVSVFVIQDGEQRPLWLFRRQVQSFVTYMSAADLIVCPVHAIEDENYVHTVSKIL